jgi:hypothetical protein
MIALFNKNKNFIGFCDNFPEYNNDNFLKIEVPEKYADPYKYTWVGDYYNGEFLEIEKALIIKQKEKLIEDINKKYPIEIQLLNIIKQLNILSNKEKIYDNNFKQMSNEILNIWK